MAARPLAALGVLAVLVGTACAPSARCSFVRRLPWRARMGGLVGDSSAAYETLPVVARRLATIAIWLVVWLPL